MEKLRIALCGGFGHVEKFGAMINDYEESETVAVWDNVPGRGKNTAEKVGCVYEGDYDRLLDDGRLDGVVIVAENALHKEMIIKAARHGVNVFVEKPLCVKPDDAKEIQQVIHESGVRFFMTDPFVRNGAVGLKNLIRDGVLGDITQATFCLGTGSALKGFVNYNRDQTGGGIMADVGGHMIHQAHYQFGKPEKLSASLGYITEKAKENRIEETALVTMQYPDEKTVSLQCSWVSGSDVSLQSVWGTKGCAWIRPDEQAGKGNEILAYQLGKEAVVELRGEQLPPPQTRHIRYWIEMILQNTPNDMVGVDPLSNSGVSIDNAVEFVEIIDAIYRSAEKGGTVVAL